MLRVIDILYQLKCERTVLKIVTVLRPAHALAHSALVLRVKIGGLPSLRIRITFFETLCVEVSH